MFVCQGSSLWVSFYDICVWKILKNKESCRGKTEYYKMRVSKVIICQSFIVFFESLWLQNILWIKWFTIYMVCITYDLEWHGLIHVFIITLYVSDMYEMTHIIINIHICRHWPLSYLNMHWLVINKHSLLTHIVISGHVWYKQCDNGYMYQSMSFQVICDTDHVMMNVKFNPEHISNLYSS